MTEQERLRQLEDRLRKAADQLRANTPFAASHDNLRSTRDLLLPRLVSGEIDVSELEIETKWLAS